MKQRIGLLGGTFDPVHRGHIELAELAVAELELDCLYFLPAVSPPHKNRQAVTALEHRLNMLRLALHRHHHLRICLAELQLPQPSYTINTIHFLQSQWFADDELFFVIGFDSLRDFPTWKKYREILSLVHIVVGHRDRQASESALTAIASQLGYERTSPTRWSSSASSKYIMLLQGIVPSISSSAIRQNIHHSRPEKDDLVSSAVRRYIIDHQLYLASADREV